MENLPDDVVAKIFSLLEPHVLLDIIPVVCKRWHQLAKHPDSWRTVELVVSASEIDVENLELSKRIAKFAPHLYSVDLSDVDMMNPQIEAILKDLLRGKKTVKSLRTLPTQTTKMRKYTKRMIKKFAPSLREVLLTFVEPEVWNPSFHASIDELLCLVSKVPRMEFLGLDFIAFFSNIEYKGQLGKGCPALKTLSMIDIRSNNAIAVDILRTKKEMLQEVRFIGRCQPTAELSSALRDCHRVVSCEVPIALLPAVEHMSELQYLDVEFSSKPPESVSMIESFIKSSVVLSNLDELSLSSNNPTPNNYISTCVELLVEKCTKIENLSLCSIGAHNHVMNLIFSKLANIQDLKIFDCFNIKSQHIDNLRTATKLRSLELSGLIVSTEEDGEHIKDAVAALQLQNPMLKTKVAYELLEDYGVFNEDFDSEEDAFLGLLGGVQYDYDDEYNFTYYDYLRNKYGEDISDQDLFALMSSDDED